MFKRLLFTLGTIALVAVVGIAGVLVAGKLAPSASAQTSQPDSGYSASQVITVVGVGQVYVQPDIAQATIGVETMAETVSKAVQENEAKMKAILAALKAAGLADKDIQTANYSVSVDMSQPGKLEGEPEAAKPQYRVSNMVSVKVRDLAKVGDVIDAVVEAGANNIWGVSFGVDDSKAAESDARAKAMADALARAEALAGLGQVELGPIMSISETVGGGAYPLVAERALGGDSSLSPGEIEVTYQVQVSYFIER